MRAISEPCGHKQSTRLYGLGLCWQAAQHIRMGLWSLHTYKFREDVYSWLDTEATRWNTRLGSAGNSNGNSVLISHKNRLGTSLWWQRSKVNTSGWHGSEVTDTLMIDPVTMQIKYSTSSFVIRTLETKNCEPSAYCCWGTEKGRAAELLRRGGQGCNNNNNNNNDNASEGKWVV